MTTKKAPAPITAESVQERYDFACAQRDEIEARCVPLRAAATAAADKAEEFRVKAMEAKAVLDEARGGASWRELKKEIALLAKLLPRK